MRHEAEPEDLGDLTTWMRSTLEKMDSMDAVLHDMRTELANRLYAERLKRDPDFKRRVRIGREMIASPDNSDRIPAEKFLEWAEGLRPSP